jgi:hypothetical protein
MTSGRTLEARGEPAAYELAYHEAVRAIEAQGASLTWLRGRAGMVVSAASLVAGFLGPVVVPSGGPSPLSIVAGLFLVLAAGGAVFVLMPIKRWHPSTNAQDLISV